jgi:CxxC motif-containing protein
MTNRELTCIGCPMGCILEVQLDGTEVVKVTGNTCPRGKDYGIKECTNPTRIVTSSVAVENGVETVASVKTERDIPKEKVYDVIRLLKDITIKAPVNIGDIVLENIFNTGVNIIATKKIDEKN